VPKKVKTKIVPCGTSKQEKESKMIDLNELNSQLIATENALDNLIEANVNDLKIVHALTEKINELRLSIELMTEKN